MSTKPKYYIVESSALPEVFLKVAEAKRLLSTGEASTVNEATRMTDISRSAFYKYRDAVLPFQSMMTGRIITFQLLLHDEQGLLSAILGGFAAAASPIVCNLRGMTLKESIGQTKEMYRITMEKNYNFPIPNLDFDFLPVGIDIRKVLKEGVCPAIHGGMFNRVGGLIGAGMARVPMQCFEKALVAFGEKYL